MWFKLQKELNDPTKIIEMSEVGLISAKNIGEYVRG